PGSSPFSTSDRNVSAALRGGPTALPSTLTSAYPAATAPPQHTTATTTRMITRLRPVRRGRGASVMTRDRTASTDRHGRELAGDIVAGELVDDVVRYVLQHGPPAAAEGLRCGER